MKLMQTLAIVAAFLSLSGCAWLGLVHPTETDRQLNRQNVDAGYTLETSSSDPTVKQIGSDVKENSLALEKNLLGKPENPKPYSAQMSKELREKSDKERATPWWQLALGGVGTVLLGVLVRGLAAGPIGPAATVLVEGITRLRQAVKSAPDGKLTLDEGQILGIVSEAQKDPKVKSLIASLAHKAEAKLLNRM